MNIVGWLAVIGLFIVGFIVLWRAFLIEPYDLKLERHSVRMNGQRVKQPNKSSGEPNGKADKKTLPASGLRILHITDLHIKGLGELQWQVIGQARALQPDLIAVTGDFLSNGRALPFLAPLLMELSQVAPIYAVLGDNDFEAENSPERLVAELKRSGVRLLRNEADLFIQGDQALVIVGVDDPNTDRADLVKALKEADQLWRRSRFAAEFSADTDLASAPIVVLAHSPEIVRDHDSRVSLYLTGHTHGGQICLPGGIALSTNTRGVPRYASGLFNIEGSLLYVNRGVGTARIPARLFCPPEVAIFDLQ